MHVSSTWRAYPSSAPAGGSRSPQSIRNASRHLCGPLPLCGYTAGAPGGTYAARRGGLAAPEPRAARRADSRPAASSPSSLPTGNHSLRPRRQARPMPVAPRAPSSTGAARVPRSVFIGPPRRRLGLGTAPGLGPLTILLSPTWWKQPAPTALTRPGAACADTASLK